MSTNRILLAAVLGAIAMFFWSFIAHMLLPLGEAGIREMPNEKVVLDAMGSSLVEDAVYIFPGAGLGPNPTRQQEREAMQRMAAEYTTKPSGFLVYHAPGRQFNFGKCLAGEFATELSEALLVVFLLAQTRLVSFAARVGFVTLAGVLAAVTTNVSYWNWYGFPAVYTAGYMTTQIVGFVCLGVVVALFSRKAATA